MDNIPEITPISQRKYEMIPVDQIKVINSRDRDQAQFDMNVESIDHTGLLKPIRVNDKFHERSGWYELICGEGRLLAHKKLGHDQIKAEIVTCSRKEAYLQSLIENIARTKPGSIDFARELKRLHEEGWSYKQIAGIACKTESYIREYIRLVDQGEERLIRGVEQGVFSITFAIQVASTDDSQMQNLLMDAFDEKLVTTENFAQARKIIISRSESNKAPKIHSQYTVSQLRRDISDATKRKESYIREAESKENRFMTLLSYINMLWKDPGLLELLRAESLSERPDLAGNFRYETC